MEYVMHMLTAHTMHMEYAIHILTAHAMHMEYAVHNSTYNAHAHSTCHACAVNNVSSL